MKRPRLLLFAAAAAALAALLGAQSSAPPSDPVFQAMRDELSRAKAMTVSNLEGPYFVEYVINEEEDFTVTANLGGLVSRQRQRFRLPEIHVRVGDYKFDNTNVAGAGFGGSRYDLEHFPLEDSYPLLRRYLWLLTDGAYKSAVETISRKRAALRNIQQSDQLDDFAHAEPVQSIRPLKRLLIDEDALSARVRALSAIFAGYPEIKTSGVDLEASEGGFHLVNTEGSEVREPESVTFIRARAYAQAADGASLRDAVAFYAQDAAHLPPQPEMERVIGGMAANLVTMSRAPKGEDYNGPVLFEGAAGAQVFAEVLGRNLVLTRPPAGGGGRGGAVQASEFEGRAGARVLPETFDVVDDPAQTEWRGRALFGTYKVDREAVPAKPLRLIEKGVLKNYLLTRQPVRGYEGSNGRARLPGNFGASMATISNLFVSSSDAMPVGELEKKMVELIKSRNKPYGIVVRKMDFPSSGSPGELRGIMAGQQGRPVSLPILVYKILPDGHEEMVRGLRFRGFNARSLKDILAAGNDSNVLEYMENGALFALIGGGGFTTEACVIAPSILIDDLELHPIEEEQPKLPIVSAPEMTH
ncbi:MAG TPA: metallopeptidase TldD-related protein [Candidatus Acidoferrales bacterium]|nr:metallopeptidase TldD-related protein [Candidatus Acidoferrales bacterium]